MGPLLRTFIFGIVPTLMIKVDVGCMTSARKIY